MVPPAGDDVADVAGLVEQMRTEANVSLMPNEGDDTSPIGQYAAYRTRWASSSFSKRMIRHRRA